MNYVELLFDIFRPNDEQKKIWLERDSRVDKVLSDIDTFLPMKGTGRLPWLFIYEYCSFNKSNKYSDELLVLAMFDKLMYATELSIGNRNFYPTLIKRGNYSFSVDQIHNLDNIISSLEKDRVKLDIANLYKNIIRDENVSWYISTMSDKCLRVSFAEFEKLAKEDKGLENILGMNTARDIVKQSSFSLKQTKYLWLVYFRVNKYLATGEGDYHFKQSDVVGLKEFLNTVLKDSCYLSFLDDKSLSILKTIQFSEMVSTYQIKYLLNLREDLIKVFKKDFPSFSIPKSYVSEAK